MNVTRPNALIEIAKILLEFEVERITAGRDEFGDLTRPAAGSTAQDNPNRLADSTPTGKAGQKGGQ